MSSSKQPRTASPLQSTRQMLDELDSLMERMLSLPVGDAEELPPLPRDVRQAPALTASLTMAEEVAVEEEPRTAAIAEEPPAPEPTRHVRPEKPASIPLWQEMAPAAAEEHVETSYSGAIADDRLDAAQRVREPHFAAESFVQELPPPMVIRPIRIITTPSEGEEMPRSAPRSAFVRPLIWVNQTFDHCTTWLGPLGRGLRGSRGRAFIGAIGLLCLGIAGAWFAIDQAGWPR